jgi:ketosteroid isomerase-like protein
VPLAELSSRTFTLFAALDRRDWDAFFAHADPEVESTPLNENPSYRGRGALIAYLERRLTPWIEFHLELETVEFSEDEERMLTTACYAGSVRGSAKLISGHLSSVIEPRAGRSWRGEEYPDKHRARQALQWRGEQPPPGSADSSARAAAGTSGFRRDRCAPHTSASAPSGAAGPAAARTPAA